jgi:hypothetical protein
MSIALDVNERWVLVRRLAVEMFKAPIKMLHPALLIHVKTRLVIYRSSEGISSHTQSRGRACIGTFSFQLTGPSWPSVQ